MPVNEIGNLFMKGLGGGTGPTHVTATYTVLQTDTCIVVDTSLAAVTIQLPAPETMAGRMLAVRLITKTSNVTVTADNSTTGDVADTSWSDVVLTVSGAKALFYSDGFGWTDVAVVDLT